MNAARMIFVIAGVYGLVTLLPLYFLETRIGVDTPPPLTHVEYFYGFIGTALAWQVLFFMIARDPIRYRRSCALRSSRSSRSAQRSSCSMPRIG